MTTSGAAKAIAGGANSKLISIAQTPDVLEVLLALCPIKLSERACETTTLGRFRPIHETVYMYIYGKTLFDCRYIESDQSRRAVQATFQ